MFLYFFWIFKNSKESILKTETKVLVGVTFVNHFKCYILYCIGKQIRMRQIPYFQGIFSIFSILFLYGITQGSCVCYEGPGQEHLLMKIRASLFNMTVFRSWMNKPLKWLGKITMTHLLIVTRCYMLAVLISHLKYLLIFVLISNISCQRFV